MKTRLGLTFFLFLAGQFACLASSHFKWLVFYGSDLSVRQIRDVEWVILEPDHHDVSNLKKETPAKFIAYLSLGEVNESRTYWPEVKSAAIEANPEWPGAHRMDLRSTKWQSVILDQIIPSLIQKGYDGLFFDTMDTAIYLEQTKGMDGSVNALTGLIHKIHKKYPKLLLIPNNGLELLESLGDAVAAVAVEDLYLGYDFEKKKIRKTLSEADLYKEGFLTKFKSRGKKVLVILYGNSPKGKLEKEAIKKVRKKGFDWYLGDIQLNTLGHVAQ